MTLQADALSIPFIGAGGSNASARKNARGDDVASLPDSFPMIPRPTPCLTDSLPSSLRWAEFVHFAFKQARACLFGALLLLAIVATGWWYPDIGLARYDFLFLYALAIQACLILFKLESLRELGVILLFHAMATAMELFKTSQAIGSWSYPEDSMIRIGAVPLFTGFMYSAVGSYMARAWRIFDFSFTRFPPLWIAGTIAVLAYLNFFTHHYLPDFRWLLILAGIAAFARTRVRYTPLHRPRHMNLLVGFALVAFFIWIAENLGTFARAWRYPDQEEGWRIVHFSKLSAWYLLIQLSFVLIYGLRRLEARIGRAH